MHAKSLFAAWSAAALAGCITTSSSNTGNTTQRARNVILFIGDGMGVSTVTATRIYAGQNNGMDGEENVLPFETFPHLALVKTYNTNQQVPDSAGTASAIHSGAKTRAGVLNIAPQAERGNCSASQNAHMKTLGEIATENGKAVGIVTTTRLTHATPASLFAHSPERNWESDSNIPNLNNNKYCTDIASQLIAFNFDTALGGGRREFIGSALGGRRKKPDANLLATWQKTTGGTVVTNAREMANANHNTPVLGVFADSHLPFVNQTNTQTIPTLTDMTEYAIKRLSQRNSGYYLLVEGGRIDHAHHQNAAGLALAETEEFARAVAKALQITDPNNTLILVTADHSHVFTLGGYPTRGNPILGHVIANDNNGNPKKITETANDQQIYTSAGYANGPAAVKGQRPSPDTGTNARIQALIPLNAETHGGEDVALYAYGPMDHQVAGVMEQNLIFDVILAAFGWNKYSAADNSKHAQPKCPHNPTPKLQRQRRSWPLILPHRQPPLSAWKFREQWLQWPRHPLTADPPVTEELLLHRNSYWHPVIRSMPEWPYHTKKPWQKWPRTPLNPC